MSRELVITQAFSCAPDVFVERLERKARDKGVKLTRTGAYAGTFVAKRLWVTLLAGSYALADGVATVTLSTVPPLMTEAQIRAKVLEKLARLDAGAYDSGASEPGGEA